MNNIARARTRIFEYSMVNEFDYFVTLTLNKNKQDRYDLREYIKNLGQFIRDYRKKYKVDIQYLLIPEKHIDGAWHMHGLLKNIEYSHLERFTLDMDIPDKLKKMIKNGRTIYNFPLYQNKFGWVTLEKVKNQEACSKYMTKYISKSLNSSRGVTEKEQKLYYVSRGLKLPELVQKGSLNSRQVQTLPWTYQNEYINELIMDKETYLRLFDK